MEDAGWLHADVLQYRARARDTDAAPDEVRDQHRVRGPQGKLAATGEARVLAGEPRFADGHRDLRRCRGHSHARPALRPQARVDEGSVPGNVGSDKVAHFVTSQAVGRMQNALCILLLVITSSAVFAQGIGPVTFRDSLVMRQMIYRTPCPDPVPPAWSSVDSTLGRRPRCAIVETAAQALLPWANSDPRRAIDPWNP